MYTTSPIYLLLTLLTIYTTNACIPTRRDIDHSDAFIIGSDGPAPAKTLGFALNHIGLVTTNLTGMKHFYGDILGMRLLFDAHVTAEYTVTYLGYAQGGRNGTGFQSGAELAAAKNNLWGLLELQQFNVSDDRLIASTERTNTFGHVGLVVPDIVKAQDYFESQGVRILKRVEEPLKDYTGPVPNAFGLGEYAGLHLAAKKALIDAQGLIGLEFFLMIADPDGNLVEIQQQDS
jgi:lactoylglutathione lyase